LLGQRKNVPFEEGQEMDNLMMSRNELSRLEVMQRLAEKRMSRLSNKSLGSVTVLGQTCLTEEKDNVLRVFE